MSLKMKFKFKVGDDKHQITVTAANLMDGHRLAVKKLGGKLGFEEPLRPADYLDLDVTVENLNPPEPDEEEVDGDDDAPNADGATADAEA